MLHTKSKSHQASGFGEEFLKVFFTICGYSCHLGHVTKTICINFSKLIIIKLHMKSSSIGLVVSEKICFNILMGLQYE